MRSPLLLAVILSAAMLSACTKREANCCAPPYIPGKWKLSETQVSNGSVSGFIPYKGPAKYVVFYADGRLTTPPDIMGFDYDRYVIESYNEILLVRTSNADSVRNFYELSGNSLTIHYKGIEPNGVRFKRVSQ